eukprot:7502982-Alexandrium_andersonii.AAC.1
MNGRSLLVFDLAQPVEIRVQGLVATLVPTSRSAEHIGTCQVLRSRNCVFRHGDVKYGGHAQAGNMAKVALQGEPVHAVGG